MKSTNGASAAKEYTFDQLVSSISRLLYESAYEGCRWKHQGEQGNCWWDRKTQTYISTSELYRRMGEAIEFDRSERYKWGTN